MEFSARFGKTYGSKNEHNSRFETFKQNYLKMKTHNDLDKGFKLGINKFSDLTEEEFLSQYGTLKETSSYDKKYVEISEVSSDLKARFLEDNINQEEKRYYCPHDEDKHNNFDYGDFSYIDQLDSCDSINWVKEGKVGAPKDQNSCGSCWAHSTIVSIEALYAQQNNISEASLVPSFSEQQLVDCNFIPNLGCMGGRREYAYNYSIAHGLTYSSLYPYVNELQDCSYDEQTMKKFQIQGFKAWERMNNPDLRKLLCQGVVSVGIRINDCIKSYSSGIITDLESECGCSRIPSCNHAVALVGFGFDKANTKCQHYYLAKNSWGESWGEKGYFRLCAEDQGLMYGTCNIKYEPMIAL